MIRRLLLFRFSEYRPLSIIIAAYQLLMALLILLHFNQVTGAVYWLCFHIAIILFTTLPLKGKLSKVRGWSPVWIIPINFSELHYLVHTVHPVDYDALLAQIDYWLFGVHPTVWLEQFTIPWLTELLQIIYSTFYFLPIVLALLLLKNRQEEKFALFIFQITFGFYLSYIGYFMAPALGPRFELDHLQSFPLTGIWIMEDIQLLLNQLEKIQRDAFPSGHTSLTLLTLYYAGRYHRTWYNVMIPLTVLMMVATVYLRYHYVVDIFAGLLWFWMNVRLGEWLYLRLQKKE